MADTKISALTAASVAAAANEFGINEAGTSKKLTLAQIITFLQTKGMPRVATVITPHSNSTTTPTEVSNLTQVLEAGTFLFEHWLIVRSSLAGTAPVFNLNFTGTAAPFNWWYEYADNSATLLAALGVVSHNVSTQSLGFGMRQSENTEATSAAGNMGPVGGVQTAATDALVMIRGLIVVSVSGDLELWHGSETANATTVEVGSSVKIVRTA